MGIKTRLCNIQNKFLLCLLFIIFILTLIIFFPAFDILPFGNFIFTLLFFTPLITAFLVYFISLWLFKKVSKVTKIILTILSAIGILKIFSDILFFTAFIILTNNADYVDKIHTTKEEYPAALKSMDKPNVKHFPKEIPLGAKNVKLYGNSNPVLKSHNLSLYLESDRNFIIDSFRGINCIETEGPYDNKDKYKYHIARNRAVENVKIPKTGLKFCVIDSYGDTEEHGIAVDYKNNRILFYSILLD